MAQKLSQKWNESAIAALAGLGALILSRLAVHHAFPNIGDAILVMVESGGLLFALKVAVKAITTDTTARMSDEREPILLVGALALSGVLAAHLSTLIEVLVLLDNSGIPIIATPG
jgi:hypothetical protein